MAYSIASDATTPSDPAPLAAITPAATTGVAILSMSAGCQDSGSFAARIRLSRASGGATPTAATPDKTDRFAPAAAATCAQSFGTSPTLPGNPLVVIGKSNTASRVTYARWIAPNARYPVYSPASGGMLYMDEPGEASINADRVLTFGEDKVPGATGFGRYRGRRGARGGFYVQDYSGGFAGLSTGPKCIPGSQGYRFLNALEWNPQFQQDAQIFLNVLNGGGGTLFTISLDGSVTPTGALTRQVGKSLAGSVTAAGALLRQVGKALSGSVTPTGALAKQIAKALGGSVTAVGALARQTGKAMSGSVAAVGAVVRQAGKSCAGTVTATGALVKEIRKTFGGSVTPAGALTVIRTILLFLSGSVTPTGTLTRQVGKAFAGSVTVTGGILKLIGKAFVGVVSAIGSVTIIGGSPPPIDGRNGPNRYRHRTAPYPSQGDASTPRHLRRRK